MNDGTHETTSANGPADLFTTVFAQRSDVMVRIVASVIGDWHRAEDIVQEAFTTAFPYSSTTEQELLDRVRREIGYQLDNSVLGMEVPAEIGDWQGVPAVPAAEDEALANVVVFEMLTQEPTPLGVAA
ncbi:hypothetical protein AB0M64_19855 [Streptomyces sp. NPDC051771]|uniref:RNA polymerase sigma factor n=1 Tax=Streptomyces sp. NPDC051771 TaxID=3154847 RepID=UPI0034498E34